MDVTALDGNMALVQGHSSEIIHLLSTAILIYCGVKALYHKELRKVLIYAFVGMVVDARTLLDLGSSQAVPAFLSQIFVFSISIGMMYLAVKAISAKTGSDNLDDLQGIGRVMPKVAIPLGAGLFAMMGMPPFATFFSKLLMVSAFIDSGKIVSSLIQGGAEILYFLVFLRVLKIIFLRQYEGEARTDCSNAVLVPLYVLLVFNIIGGVFPAVAIKPFVGLAKMFGAVSVDVPLFNLSWPLPVLCLSVGALIVYFYGRKSNKVAGLMASGFCVLSMLFLTVTDRSGVGNYGIGFAILILFMGALQFFYSVSYMDHSHKQYRFYTFFMLMIAGLLGVSLTGDLFSMFFFWEVMSGWVLYLALVHEEDDFSIQEASKYFLFNYLGAVFLTIGVLVMYKISGSWAYEGIVENFSYTQPAAIGIAMLSLGFLMKAAQLPFRIDFQMHPKPAPTPISGYISSTMLKSGPFMMVKIFFIGAAGYSATSFLPLETIMYVSAWIGALTIVMAASFAMLTNSMKRLLIYHTVSQLGYVVVGCALMTSFGLAGGLLHFANHMFFKNLLFLCAGAVFISTSTDRMDELGGLAKKMPVTFFCFMIGVFAISGVPLFSGFVSKWMIYHAVMDKGFVGIAVLSLFGSVLTLASFIKFMHSAYLGQIQEKVENAKEASWYMLAPMLILTALCVLLGIFPSIALVPINSMLSEFNLQPLSVGVNTVTHGADSLNMLYLTVILLLGCAMVVAAYFMMKTKTRSTHVYACGAGDLTAKDSHVASDNFYEDSKGFIKGTVKFIKKISGMKGGYVER